ncbi:MAG: hypothetical protein Q9163_004231 [Psora crenata]
MSGSAHPNFRKGSPASITDADAAGLHNTIQKPKMSGSAHPTFRKGSPASITDADAAGPHKTTLGVGVIQSIELSDTSQRRTSPVTPPNAPTAGQGSQRPKLATNASPDELRERMEGSPGTTDARRQDIYQRMLRHQEEWLAREAEQGGQEKKAANPATGPVNTLGPTPEQEQRRRKLRSRIAAIERKEAHDQARVAAAQAADAVATTSRGVPQLSEVPESIRNSSEASTIILERNQKGGTGGRTSNTREADSAPGHGLSMSRSGRTASEQLQSDMMQATAGPSIPSDRASAASRSSSPGKSARPGKGALTTSSKSKDKNKTSEKETTRQKPRPTKITKSKPAEMLKGKALPRHTSPPKPQKPPAAEESTPAKAMPVKARGAPQAHPAAQSKKRDQGTSKAKGKSTKNTDKTIRKRAAGKRVQGRLTKTEGASNAVTSGSVKKTGASSTSKAAKTSVSTPKSGSGAAASTDAAAASPRPRRQQARPRAAANNPLPLERGPDWSYRRGGSPIQLRSMHERLDYDHHALDQHLLSRRRNGRAGRAGGAGGVRGDAQGKGGGRRVASPSAARTPQQPPPGGAMAAAADSGVFVLNERSTYLG